jgi:hypothetical protein
VIGPIRMKLLSQLNSIPCLKIFIFVGIFTITGIFYNLPVLIFSKNT